VIDFRYHLVSIIAVFLALAVGLVVGATALSGKSLDLLQAAQKAALGRIAALEHDNSNLTNQQKADEAFANAASPLLVPHLLAGQRVVVVTAPNYDPAVAAGVIKALQQAGATVTGQVNVNGSFLLTDGHDEDQLTQLAQRLAAQDGVTLPAQLSSPVGGQQAASKVLAASLLTAGGNDLSSADSAAILSAFSTEGYASAGPVSAPASLAVLVAPSGPPPQTGRRVLVALAVALRNAGSGTVMVGGAGSVGPYSVIDAENKAKQVSTVDNADTETGQIMTVQALKLLLDHKQIGHYGIGPGAAPSPAPTPSSSISATVTPNVSSSPGGHK